MRKIIQTASDLYSIVADYSKLKIHHCDNCNIQFIHAGGGSVSKYCSPKCRQKSYRVRKEVSLEKENENLQLEESSALNQAIKTTAMNQINAINHE